VSLIGSREAHDGYDELMARASNERHDGMLRSRSVEEIGFIPMQGMDAVAEQNIRVGDAAHPDLIIRVDGLVQRGRVTPSLSQQPYGSVIQHGRRLRGRCLVAGVRCQFGESRGATVGTWPSTMDKGLVGGTVDNTGLTYPVLDFNDPQHLEGYAYANNKPVVFEDPAGTDFWG